MTDRLLADEFLRSTRHPDDRNAVIYDTDQIANPIEGPKLTLHGPEAGFSCDKPRPFS